MERSDVAVIGAGVVGLAAAWELSAAGARVTVVERHPGAGHEQSTHNSQVIHSGAFVRPGTVRAQLVMAGNPRLYAVAEELGVRAERCGTLVAAVTDAEVPRLEQYLTWGRANGVEGTERLGPSEARRLEPNLGPVTRALWLPSGGRIDVPALLRRLTERLRERGVRFELGFPVTSASRSPSGWVLAGPDSQEVGAGAVVNAAGVGSGEVAGLLGLPGIRIYPCLGEYARVTSAKRGWVRSMVYGFPPPGYPGIGPHLTRLVDGELLLGPTATYLDAPSVPPRPVTSLATFAQEAERLLPGLTVDDLAPHPPGIRAKLVPPESGEAFGDFVVREGPPESRTFHLIGIESPGLTASFAIGQRVANWFRERSG